MEMKNVKVRFIMIAEIVVKPEETQKGPAPKQSLSPALDNPLLTPLRWRKKGVG